jgi:hypothetical protein
MYLPFLAEDQGKLDKRLKAKKKQLEDTFDAVVKKKQVFFNHFFPLNPIPLRTLFFRN